MSNETFTLQDGYEFEGSSKEELVDSMESYANYEIDRINEIIEQFAVFDASVANSIVNSLTGIVEYHKGKLTV